MSKLLRDLFDLTFGYLTACIAGIGWIFYGTWIMAQPVADSSFIPPELNQDVGTSLVAQGVIVTITFAVATLVRVIRGNKELVEQRKDREMLREVHKWMKDSRENTAK